MLTRKSFIRMVTISVLLVMGLVVGMGCQPQAGNAGGEIVYDRVISSGVIRASYASYPPYCIKDPTTGELSGLFVETLEEMAERLNLKVEWTEEVGWGAIFEGLQSGRHDIFGAGIWRNGTRGRVGDFTIPVIYNVIKVYGRPGESFGTDLAQLNQSSVRIATMDGAIEDVIAQADYPEASRVSVPQLNPWSDVLLNITTGKADLTFAEPAAVNLYLEQNPGTLVEYMDGTPIRVFSNTYAMKHGEPSFKSMLESALIEIRNDGTLEQIISRYEKVNGEFLRVSPGYVN